MGNATYGTVRRLDMTAIADAIRAKGGASGSLSPSEMASAIANIPAGGGITADNVARREIAGVISGSATIIASYAFASCSLLSVASFPSCKTIHAYAFYSCSSLSYVSFPSCSTIGSSAFGSCSSLSVASFPSCLIVASSAFRGCSSLSVASFRLCNEIRNYAFYGCTSLSYVSLPNCSTIGGSAFGNCSSLVSLFFRAYNMKSIANTVFANTNSTFRICVPTSLVTYYQTLSGWSRFASQIEAFDD